MSYSEFGGCLPFELLVDKNGREYFDSKEYNVKRLNCGRSAIVLAIRTSKAIRVFLPIYICDSVKNAVQNEGCQIEYYHINEDFFPEVDDINKDDILIWVNYFGIFGNAVIKEIVSRYENVIIDNTQAFFCEPNKDAYNIYSCRKFVGVPDGAYLISPTEIIGNFETDVSSDRSSFLLKAWEQGSNSAYTLSKNNEDSFSYSGIRGMSLLTQRILLNVTYETIIEKRIENYRYIHDRLKNFNLLKCDLENGVVPMIYPFVYKSDTMREYLIDNKVFVPTWWRSVKNSNPNDIENGFVDYLYPLPIDQRYTIDDMERIIEIVLMGIET